MMKTYLALVLVFLLSVTAGPGRVEAQEASDSSVGRELSASPNPPDANDPPDWLFPIAKLDQSLPSWIHIGGQGRVGLAAARRVGTCAAAENTIGQPFRSRAGVRNPDCQCRDIRIELCRVLFEDSRLI